MHRRCAGSERSNFELRGQQATLSAARNPAEHPCRLDGELAQHWLSSRTCALVDARSDGRHNLLLLILGFQALEALGGINELFDELELTEDVIGRNIGAWSIAAVPRSPRQPSRLVPKNLELERLGPPKTGNISILSCSAASPRAARSHCLQSKVPFCLRYLATTTLTGRHCQPDSTKGASDLVFF